MLQIAFDASRLFFQFSVVTALGAVKYSDISGHHKGMYNLEIEVVSILSFERPRLGVASCGIVHLHGHGKL